MLRSRLRSSVRRVRDSISEGQSLESSTELFRKMTSIADSSVRKGIIHGNRAARIKQRLNQALRKLAQ